MISSYWISIVELEVTRGLFQGAFTGQSGTDLDENMKIGDKAPYPIAFFALTLYL